MLQSQRNTTRRMREFIALSTYDDGPSTFISLGVRSHRAQLLSVASIDYRKLTVGSMAQGRGFFEDAFNAVKSVASTVLPLAASIIS